MKDPQAIVLPPPVRFPTALGRALHAETLKLRGTLALWMCGVAPALVAAVVTLQLLFSETRGPALAPAEAWNRLAYGLLALWSFLMLPLFVTLEAALLAQLDHASHQWRRWLALPLPRGVHYLAKWLALAGLLLAAQLAMVALVPLAAGVLMLFKPGFGLAGGPPWAMLLGLAGKGYLAALLIVALHTWIALRWRSFAVACGVGMGATVMGFLIGQSERYGPWYPWSLPVQTMADGADPFAVIGFALAGAALVTAVGAWAFQRADHD